MRIPFTESHRRGRQIRVESGARARVRGVALVITLVMLAVITFMAVTFLVLSSRERGAVNTTTDQTSAGFTADTAVERAKIELLARVMAFTNDQNYGLIVSTNFINPLGFQPGNSDPTNVNYEHLAAPGVGPLPSASFQRNVANLFYNPRPPVFVPNPTNSTIAPDFRYYLDLNRNSRYDTNGFLPVISPDVNNPYYNTNGTTMTQPLDGQTVSNWFIGDPEWIGVLEYSDRPHSANNKFLARYAYIVAPAGQTLDLNYIHNNSARANTINGSYRRNMGVGTWEMNLAAFLVDLNTNQWGQAPLDPVYYRYLPLTGAGGYASGFAFDDAQALLNFRYGPGGWNNLQSMSQVFGPASQMFRTDHIDEFGGVGGGAGAAASYMTGTTLPTTDGDNGRVNGPGWPGADNPNHFFTTQEFFDQTKTSPALISRLQAAGNGISSYDRYTFYRMLAQLGTDSTPEQGKINLNYLNVDPNGNVVPGMETNLISWGDNRIKTTLGYPAPGPLVFFTNAAARMFTQLNLRDGNNNLITFDNIPIYPVNYYTPAVHRILQLAANMFEATTNGLFPSIYRPYFYLRGGTNIYISGYEFVNGPNDSTTASSFLTAPLDLNTPAGRASITRVAPAPPDSVNIYGVPWVIGARKGFPNVNEVLIQSVTQISRKIRMTDNVPGSSYTANTPPSLSRFSARQILVVGVSNVIGVEFWNSYSNAYPRPAYIQANGNLTMQLTNDAPLEYPAIPLTLPMGGAVPGLGSTNLAAGQWAGTGWTPGQGTSNINTLSFVVPLITNYVFLADMAYRQSPPGFVSLSANNVLDWSINPVNSLPQPHWGLSITNNMRCVILDGGPSGRVIDYVQLGNLNSVRDLTAEALSDDTYGLWRTNPSSFGPFTNIAQGVVNQISIAHGGASSTGATISDTDWSDYGGVGARVNAQRAFAEFLGFTQGPSNYLSVMQIPFTPTSKRYQSQAFQVNDPLVHYVMEDLTGPTNRGPIRPPNTSSFPSVGTNLWRYTDRYDPWANSPNRGIVDSYLDANTALKDPMVRASDDWDFPTNKLPNIGWLGRIHRGTPWQTVYLKASDITQPLKWQSWTGNGRTWSIGSSNVNDYMFSRPVQDRTLFDLFTTALNDNATRGQLSVNQTNLAAWSAVLGGVIVMTNSSTSTNSANFGWMTIDPAGYYDPTLPSDQLPPLVQIWQGINATRANTNVANGPVFANQVFNQAGDILATPQLTEKSVFVKTNNLNSANHSAGGISDAIMERVPQQIMSLLTVNHTARFVIYAYGQTLKPADHSLVPNGAFTGLCTNYQVTAETAMRAVVRVEGTSDPQYVAGRTDPLGRSYPPHIVVESYNVLPPD